MGKREYILRMREYFKDMDLSHSYDNLTGILNRETMLGYADWLIKNHRPFSFFLVDIDNFKNVNDTYGHLVGDAVIAQSAQYLVSMAGEKGIVARYGGDEFIMIFEDVVDYDEVWNHGHDIDMRIGSVEFKGIPHLQITVSMGIARYPLNADNYTVLMELADKALYRAKMKGRNCFIIYLPEKHAHISLQKERDKKLTPMQLSFNMFNAITACGEDISLAISTVLKSGVSHFMFDHVCIESRSKLNFSVVYKLASQKKFTHIPYEVIDSKFNSMGYICLNHTASLNENNYKDLLTEFDKQKVSSALYCRIAAYGVDYGFIRIDTTSTARMWQNNEISTIMTLANYIALLLHYQNKTLDELPLVEPIEVGSAE